VSDEDVFFPGSAGKSGREGYHVAEQVEGSRGSRGKRGIPRDQADYLRSDPGTPNLSET
jgi:hypothetical protein